MSSPLASLPRYIVHADWSINSRKRWMARAVLQQDGRYVAYSPEPVGDPSSLLARLRVAASLQSVVLLGFDFPIGLPFRYAERCEVDDFLALLPRLGKEEWVDFYHVAERPEQVSLKRPFYPQRPGSARQAHLLDGLEMESIDELRRVCERAHPNRRAASPLFWTLGGQQVGKAAISGWRDVLGPALREDGDVLIWPFSGRLDELLRPGAIVVAETYPGEFYHHLGVNFPPSRPGRRSGKRSQRGRGTNAPVLLDCAQKIGVTLTPPLEAAIQDGFGPKPEGEDLFDATVGLLGMLNALFGYNPLSEPADERLRKIEGWIFGQRIP